MFQSSSPTRTSADVSRAFTLVELLVVLVIVALLVALAVPALGAARRRGWEVKSTANARTLVQLIHAYADTHRDYLPALTQGELYPRASRDVLMSAPSYQIATMWTGVVYDLLPYGQHIDVYLSPRSPRRGTSDVWPTSYHYSHAFALDPAFLTEGTTPDEAMWRHQRLSSTAQPSRKAILWDNEASFARSVSRNDGADLTIPTPVAMADVSVSMRVPADAAAPFINALSPHRLRLHNTPRGMLGTDY